MPLLKNYIELTLTYIGPGAFEGCNKLCKVKLSENLTQIQYNTFYGCGKLSSITLPLSLEYIGTGAFGNCKELTKIHIPRNVQHVSAHFIILSPAIGYISVDKDNKYFTEKDGVLYDKSMSTLIRCPEFYTDNYIDVPETVSRIKAGAFSNCTYISDIYVLNKDAEIEELEYGSFIFPKNTNIHIGNKILHIK